MAATGIKFGDAEAIALVNMAPVLLEEHKRLTTLYAHISVRCRGDRDCGLCGWTVEPGNLAASVGRSYYHERCLVNRLVGLRGSLKKLGYSLDAPPPPASACQLTFFNGEICFTE